MIEQAESPHWEKAFPKTELNIAESCERAYLMYAKYALRG